MKSASHTQGMFSAGCAGFRQAWLSPLVEKNFPDRRPVFALRWQPMQIPLGRKEVHVRA